MSDKISALPIESKCMEGSCTSWELLNENYYHWIDKLNEFQKRFEIFKPVEYMSYDFDDSYHNYKKYEAIKTDNVDLRPLLQEVSEMTDLIKDNLDKRYNRAIQIQLDMFNALKLKITETLKFEQANKAKNQRLGYLYKLFNELLPKNTKFLPSIDPLRHQSIKEAVTNCMWKTEDEMRVEMPLIVETYEKKIRELELEIEMHQKEEYDAKQEERQRTGSSTKENEKKTHCILM
ncbi:MAG: hypothetical protein Sylvanvirus1_36 [Sylvanvirus sp.]|uniref:Uncharacterized protein n=1 Tax=Sylvanvirus sp. TaxID=2487774 RepID=A0A3G5AH27_9VIRU|nr:MAG: hypothetical protein Sylvanvirus1_36 [Sylvanvirus sp.]